MTNDDAADENDNGVFFQEFGDLLEENEHQQDERHQEESAPKEENSRKKPKWWRTMVGRRGTKAQRRATASMRDYILRPAPHGTYLDFSQFNSKEIWFELGFGLGDNLLCNAQIYPNFTMLGAELHAPGVGTLLRRVQEGLEEGKYWEGYTIYSHEKDPYVAATPEKEWIPVAAPRTPPRSNNESIYSNVCVRTGDGNVLLHSIPTSSLSAVLLTFPDPWSKPDQLEFRLIQVSFVANLLRVLKQGGRFYLATDHEGYFSWSQSVMQECSGQFEPVVPVPDRSTWLPAISKYEQKGWDEGRKTLLACWQVVGKTD